MREKVLILESLPSSFGDFFCREAKKSAGVSCEPLYRKSGFLQKILFGIGYYFFPPILWFTYGLWKKNVSDFETVVVFPSRPAKYLLKYLRRKSIKTIVYYWNVADKRHLSVSFCKKYSSEVWTFDKEEAKKFGIRFGDTFCFHEEEYYEKKTTKPSLFYMGFDKPGRAMMLEKISEECRKRYIPFDCRLVRSHISKQARVAYSKPLPYEQILKLLEKNSCILELVGKTQNAPTQRFLECCFLKKKLITNCEYDEKYIKFIGESNIFILSASKNDFFNFVSTPFENSGFPLEYFCFENWLTRLLEGVEGV